MSRFAIFLLISCSLLWLSIPAASNATGLVNPGFESGMTGWTGWPTPASVSVETTTTAREGAKVGRIDFNGKNNNLFTDVTAPATNLLPGHFYTVTAWYQYRVDVQTDYPGMTLNYANSGWNLVGPYMTAGGRQGNTTTWKPIKITFKALDQPYLRIGLSGGNNKGQGVAWFDDVSFEEVAATPQNLDIYLLMGQSNMVGMEKNFDEQDLTPHPRVFMLNASKEWVPAAEPLHGVGIGPGLSFGKAMASHFPSANIGLIPIAVGNTPISDWVKGGPYYDVALNRVEITSNTGTLKGILWHQGEGDSYSKDLADLYQSELERLVTDLRTDTNRPDLPFVCGEIGKFLGSPYAETINSILRDLPNHVPQTAAVVSDGLTNMDTWHFTADSARILGQRYAAAMIRLQEKSSETSHWTLY